MTRYILEGTGDEGEPSGASDPAFRLSAWFAHKWILDYGLPTGVNGATLLILRDGISLDKWKAKT